MEETAVVVTSADLTHTRLASGPYGCSPAAESFDVAVGKWARSLYPFAAGPWTPMRLADRHPTYYGILVASLRPPLFPPAEKPPTTKRPQSTSAP
jgi:hypothetical protein